MTMTISIFHSSYAVMPTMTKPLALLKFFFLITVQLVILRFSSSASSEEQGRKRSNENSMTERFENWIQKYGRVYGSKDEWNFRFGIYQSNVQLIDSVNNQNLTYKLTDNFLADLTKEEIAERYFGYKPDPNHTYPTNSYSTPKNVTAPESIDWRTKGAVNPPRAQGCGDCWAFGAVAAVEAVTQIKTGKLLALSEQMLDDCDTNSTDHGCKGGNPMNGFEYIIKIGGITTRENYPYVGKNGTGQCKTEKLKDKAAKISSYKALPQFDENGMEAAVVNQPLSVLIEGSPEWGMYKSGVFKGQCGTNLNHAVNIVGYGNDPVGGKYWIVRNSWGDTYGEKGYIRMQRGYNKKEGLCGIAIFPSYPIV